jgi:hypothetical protein
MRWSLGPSVRLSTNSYTATEPRTVRKSILGFTLIFNRGQIDRENPKSYISRTANVLIESSVFFPPTI